MHEVSKLLWCSVTALIGKGLTGGFSF